ncbi:hypothetical protein [Leucothrix pacifica]|uniref:Uncharacterized protein n=1 Tax=Leucothrix pacifica TaxID=1247513 RepID=A0A317C1C9_9GAMM|nr:hypothetical protein [Leucothrix pacifica]PWQ92157.1 hypothetical protein DKW60_22605 [Leucothrix pacifica]
MNSIKKAALIALGTIAMGFMIFSAATIGMVVLGVGAVLAAIGFVAQPFLPKVSDGPCIIDVEPISSKID